MKLNKLKGEIKGLISLMNDKKVLAEYKKKNHPSRIIFLMKNTCNSKCIMCGLSYADNKDVVEISLKDYKTMLNNLNMDKVNNLTFSGGGDPLLCKDLIDIIEYTGQTYPDINLFTYTNGIALTRDFAREFIRHNFCQIVISVNASTAKTYREIMQVDVFDNVIENIKQLVEIRDQNSAKTKIQLSFVASRLNIDDLPGLITLGYDLGVDEINMQYCRFYSQRFKLNSNNSTEHIERKHSLFFHKAYSDEKIRRAESIARDKKIKFSHSLLFSDPKSDKNQCIWPWGAILVGPQGDIYPCGGGEVMFYKAVRDNRLYFGNLLKEHVSEFWNNADFKRVRKSCDYRNKNKSISQCWNCNHTGEWAGVNDEKSHFVEIDL